MRQAAAALFGAGFTVAACYAAESLIHCLIGQLRAALRRDERIPLAFVLGAACLHLAIFAILALHIAYWPVLVALLAGDRRGSASDRRVARRPHRSSASRCRRLSKRAPDAYLARARELSRLVYLVNAWAPEASPDGAGYHLALVARELRVHGFEPVTNNLYAMLSRAWRCCSCRPSPSGGIRRRRWCTSLSPSRWRWRCWRTDAGSGNRGRERRARCSPSRARWSAHHGIRRLRGCGHGRHRVRGVLLDRNLG